MDLTFSLYRLQSYDTQLLNIKKRVLEIVQILQSDTEVAAAAQAISDAKVVVEAVDVSLQELTEHVRTKHLKAELPEGFPSGVPNGNYTMTCNGVKAQSFSNTDIVQKRRMGKTHNLQ